jgi:hypothetical protein
MSPWQVRSKLDGAVIIVAIGSSDAHSLDFVKAAYLFDNGKENLHAGIHIRFWCGVPAGLDGSCSLDVSSGVDNAENRISTS